MVSLGIYISRESLCIAEVFLLRQKPKLLSLNEVFWTELAEDERWKVLSQEIEKREKKHRGQNIRLCYCLPQNFVSSFSLQLPFKERFKILKTIPFEVEDHTPFQSSKVLFDVRVCQIQNMNKSWILSFVTPEESVTDFLSLLKPLKKPIHSLSCSVASLANLLEDWNVPLSKAQNLESIDTYIYLGIENSYLFFYKDGFLNHISVLDWGCGEIVDEMQKVYKLNREKAWTEFFNKAFLLTQIKGFTKEQVFFSNLVKKHVEKFIPQFKLLKMSLETKKDFKISQVMIFGQGAMIKNLSVFLSMQLSASVYKLKKFSVFSDWNWKERPSGLISAGLALEGLKRYPYPGLDFLRSKKKPPSLFSLDALKRKAAPILIGFLIFSSYAFVKSYETSKLLTQVQGVFSEYARKIAYLPANQINVSAVEHFLQKQQNKLEAEDMIKKELSKDHSMSYLQTIVKKIGSAENWNLSLEYLKISGKKVAVKGKIDSLKLKSFHSVLQSLAAGKVTKSISSDNEVGSADGASANEADNNGAGGDSLELESDSKKEESLAAGRRKAENSPSSSSASQSNKNPPKRDNKEAKGQVGFSYSFQLKSEL